jgi:hypothetical protein
LRDVEEGLVVADAIGPAEQKTEKCARKKHDAKGEHRLVSGLARCWIGWSHGSESTFVNQRGARSNYFGVCAGNRAGSNFVLDPAKSADQNPPQEA